MLIRSPQKRFLGGLLGTVNSTSGSLHTPAAGILTNQAFTVCGWVNIQSTAVGTWSLFSVDNGSSDFVFLTSGAPNNAMDVKTPQGTTSSGTVFTIGTWFFVALSGSPTLATAYGKPAYGAFTKATQSSTTAGSGDSIWISNIGFGGFNDWPGYLSHVKGFNYTMSDEEVLRESLQLAPYSPRGNVFYLPFTSGPTANQDGVLKGRVWTVGGSFTSVRAMPPLPQVLVRKRYWFIGAASPIKPDTLFYGELG